MNGLIWTQDTRKRTTKPHLSRRFRSLIEQSRKRVLVFKNGNGSSGIEIVANPDRFEDVSYKLTTFLYAHIYFCL